MNRNINRRRRREKIQQLALPFMAGLLFLPQRPQQRTQRKNTTVSPAIYWQGFISPEKDGLAGFCAPEKDVGLQKISSHILQFQFFIFQI